jgi:hypothetical protein
MCVVGVPHAPAHSMRMETRPKSSLSSASHTAWQEGKAGNLGGDPPSEGIPSRARERVACECGLLHAERACALPIRAGVTT